MWCTVVLSILNCTIITGLKSVRITAAVGCGGHALVAGQSLLLVVQIQPDLARWIKRIDE